MKITLRPEEAKDHHRVEEVTREAFWNMYTPGCNEHLLVHHLRQAEQFVAALDFVALDGGEIVGNIMYVEAKVTGPEGQAHTVLTFGPVSVLPGYQGRGIGSRLITHTAALAREMGYRAILIYGDPEYYKRFGFRVSKEYNITNREGKFPAALLVLELYPGALRGIEGAYYEGDMYYDMDEAALANFDKGFAPKEKGHAKTQDRFLELVDKFL